MLLIGSLEGCNGQTAKKRFGKCHMSHLIPKSCLTLRAVTRHMVRRVGRISTVLQTYHSISAPFHLFILHFSSIFSRTLSAQAHHFGNTSVGLDATAWPSLFLQGIYDTFMRFIQLIHLFSVSHAIHTTVLNYYLSSPANFSDAPHRSDSLCRKCGSHLQLASSRKNQKFPQRSSLTATTRNPLLFPLTTTLLPHSISSSLLCRQAQTWPKTTTMAVTMTMTSHVQLVSQRRKGNVHAEKVRVLLLRLVLTHCVLFVTDCDHDGDGMHRNVHVAKIESESESEGTQRPNKNNPSADI